MRDGKEKDITELKILLCGNSGVGKTSIFKRYYENRFEGTFITSIGIDFKTKEIKYNKKLYSIHLIDTAGEERFRSITSSYFRMAEYYLLVFDLTDKNSLISLPEWIDSLKEYINNPKFFIIGNKSDLDRSQISDIEINDVINGKGNLKINNENFIKVSAKTGENIEATFKYLIDIIEQTSNEDDQIIIPKKKTKKKLVKNKKKMSCC